MKNSFPLKKIKNDLAFCNQYWTVLYGSYSRKDYIPNRSDIDIAIITQTNNKNANIELWKSFWGKYKEIYDVKIFELLPLYLKIEIINNNIVIFGDKLEISEYFYQFRKIWKDMVFRIEQNQYHNIKEKLDSIKHRKILT